MIEIILIGLYLYFIVKAVLLLKFTNLKFYNSSRIRILEIIIFSATLSILFGKLQGGVIQESVVLPKDLLLITFILLIVTLGIAIGMNFVVSKLEEHLNTREHSFFDTHGNVIQHYSGIWIAINSFIIYFILALVELSYSSLSNIVLNITILICGFILGLLASFSVYKSGRCIVSRVLIGLSLLFVLCILVLVYEGTWRVSLRTNPLLNSFSIFTLSLLVSSISLNIFYKFKHKPTKETLPEAKNKSVIYDEERSFNNLINTKDTVQKPESVISKNKIKTSAKKKKVVKTTDKYISLTDISR